MFVVALAGVLLGLLLVVCVEKSRCWATTPSTELQPHFASILLSPIVVDPRLFHDLLAGVLFCSTCSPSVVSFVLLSGVQGVQKLVESGTIRNF